MPNQTDLSLSPGQIPSPGKRNLSIPFPTFGAVPFELIDQELDRAGITSSASHLLLIRLFGLLDWTKTVRIGCHDFMSGITGYLSDKALQKVLRCGSNNTARDAMKKLVDAELVIKLDKEAGHKCNRYQIALFAPILEFLKENPPETVKVEYLAKNEFFDAMLKHTQKDNPKPVLDMDADFSGTDAEAAHNQESFKINTPHPTGSSDSNGLEAPEEEGGDLNSQRQEDAGSLFLPEKPPPAPEPVEKPKNLQKEQDVDSSLSENSSSPEPQPASEPVHSPERAQPKLSTPSPQNPDLKVSSAAARHAKETNDAKETPPEPTPTQADHQPPTRSREQEKNAQKPRETSTSPPDIAPTRQIGEAIDFMTNEKRVDAPRPDDSIEEIHRSFYPTAGAVINEQQIRASRQLKNRLESEIQKAGLQIPPLRFLRHCLKHCEHLVAEGKLDKLPTSPNFFLTGRLGPNALEYCANQLRSENAAKLQQAKTDKLLDELKNRKPSSEEEKKKFSEMMKNIKPSPPGEARRLRQQRKL